MSKRESIGAEPKRKAKSAEKGESIFSLLFPFAAVLLLIPSLLLPPEGDIRNGDAFMLVFGWLLLGGVALGIGAYFRSTRLRVADAAAWLLTGWTALSWARLTVTQTGNRLYAASGFWVFALMPLLYFVFRHTPTFSRKRLETLFFAGLLGAGFLESGIALHSYFVEAPAVRQRFRENPEELLRESGLNLEVGSPEYLLFEKRVLDSTEPIGTYGMTNTLAGLLAPILILLAGIPIWHICQRKKEMPSDRGHRLLFLTASIGSILLFGFILLLTKSRSGYLALLVGLLALPILLCLGRRDTFGAKRGTPALVSGAILLGFVFAAAAAFQSGILDREVFSEAKKSLGFRLDYWTATVAMIADHPLLGVGPGNFQTVYTRYILPTASETIADPHNFFLEYAALFGLPTLLFLGIFLAFAVRAGLSSAADKTESGEAAAIPLGGRLTFLLFLGGYLLYGFFNFLTSAPTAPALLVGFLPLFLLLAFPAVALAERMARLPSPFLLAAVGTGFLNLCAAGGIGYPPTALPLWGLAAILINRQEEKNRVSASLVRSPRKTPRLLTVGILYTAFFILFLRTNFFPVLTEKTLLPRLAEIAPDVAAEQLAIAARGHGRHSIPIRWAICDMAMYDVARLPSPQRESAWQSHKKVLFDVAPGSASLRAEIGQHELGLYEETQNKIFLTEALVSLAEASALFPTNALLHARLAQALDKAGEPDKALAERDEAFRLDALTPHEDRKLPEELKSLLTSIGKNE